MKSILTINKFFPLMYEDGNGFSFIKQKDGENVGFETRKGVEAYCKKNKCAYVEHKTIFYR